MMKGVTVKQVIKVLKTYQPIDEQDFTNLSRARLLRTKYLSRGAFRTVRTIKDTNLVVKIPLGNCCNCGDCAALGNSDNIFHSTLEIKSYKRLQKLKKYAKIKQYLPVIHFHDPKTGVILMERYRRLRGPGKHKDTMNWLSEFLTTAENLDEVDIDSSKSDNYGVDNKGNLKILDFGCIHKDANF